MTERGMECGLAGTLGKELGFLRAVSRSITFLTFVVCAECGAPQSPNAGERS